jgi:uncharacterized protein (TIGR00297 family)
MTSRARHSEDARQLVHIAMGAVAFALRYLQWWQAVVLAASAVAFNMWLLRRVTRGRLHRPSEIGTPLPGGIVFYPTSILALLLLIPGRPDIIAAAWGIMAAGDGAATLVGRRSRGPRIPWNPDKTVAGTVAFVLAGGAAGSLLAWWCRPAVIPPPYMWFSLGAPLLAALAAAAAETLPIRLDDNLTVPASAALVMWPLSLASEDLLAAAVTGADLSVALAANAFVASAGYAARGVSMSGALCGFAIGVVIFAFTGWQGWTLLLLAFAAATLASRAGLGRKRRLGIEEPRGGRRGAGNAIANTGIAAAAAAAAAVTYATDASLVVFAAALTAGASDTIASEIGKAWGRATWLVAPVRRVPPGTPGAVSVEGTLAGLIGAIGFAAAAVALGIIPRGAIVAVAAGATIGSFVESGLAAKLEASGTLNNDALNFINTGVAGYAALVLSGLV